MLVAMRRLFGDLIVPTDGSVAAEKGLLLAAQIARSTGGHITLVYGLRASLAEVDMAAASSVGSWCSPESVRQAGAVILERAAAKVDLEADRVSTELSDEIPARAIVKTATNHGASMIVMATHGRGGFQRAVFGSVAQGVLGASEIPVLLVGPHVEKDLVSRQTAPTFARVLVAVDDSDPSDAAVACAVEIGAEMKASVTFCTVLSEHALQNALLYGGSAANKEYDAIRMQGEKIAQRAVEAAKKADVDAAATVPEGPFAKTLLAAIADVQAALLVIGSHGRRGVRRFFLGTLVEELLRKSPVPVLVTRAIARGQQ